MQLTQQIVDAFDGTSVEVPFVVGVDGVVGRLQFIETGLAKPFTLSDGWQCLLE